MVQAPQQHQLLNPQPTKGACAQLCQQRDVSGGDDLNLTAPEGESKVGRGANQIGSLGDGGTRFAPE
jgi:hypothetical protein